MKPIRIFISSAQKEFAGERAFATVGGEGGGKVTPPVAPPLEVLVRLLGQAGALRKYGDSSHMCGRARSRNQTGDNPAPEGRPSTG